MQDWINININQIHLDPDPPNGIDGQCVNLASSWSMYQGGPELSGPTAYSIFQNFRSPFYDVLITTAVRPGDLAFWKANSAGFGSAGHVDIVVDNISGLGFRGFDTNWNDNPRAEYVNHNFNGFAGVFRRKGENMSVVDINVGRQIFYAFWGQNGQNGTNNALDGSLDDQIKPWLGTETNSFLNQFFNSPEGDKYRKLSASQAGNGKKLDPGKYIVS